MNKLSREFFNRNPEIVAQEILGKLLVRKVGSNFKVGKIVETEAYLSDNDRASHASRGKTKRNTPMFGPPGFSYIYFTYGIHWLLNIVTQEEGVPSAVLIRALEPVFDLDLEITSCLLDDYDCESKILEHERIGSGPAKLTKWLQINGDLNNTDITKSDILFVCDSFKVKNLVLKPQIIKKEEIVSRPRIGIESAGDDKKLPLRYYLEGNRFISKK